jgi:hypothetical protein
VTTCHPSSERILNLKSPEPERDASDATPRWRTRAGRPFARSRLGLLSRIASASVSRYAIIHLWLPERGRRVRAGMAAQGGELHLCGRPHVVESGLQGAIECRRPRSETRAVLSAFIKHSNTIGTDPPLSGKGFLAFQNRCQCDCADIRIDGFAHGSAACRLAGQGHSLGGPKRRRAIASSSVAIVLGSPSPLTGSRMDPRRVPPKLPESREAGFGFEWPFARGRDRCCVATGKWGTASNCFEIGNWKLTRSKHSFPDRMKAIFVDSFPRITEPPSTPGASKRAIGGTWTGLDSYRRRRTKR